MRNATVSRSKMAVYIRFNKRKIIKPVREEVTCLVDLDKNGEIVGIELLMIPKEKHVKN